MLAEDYVVLVVDQRTRRKQERDLVRTPREARDTGVISARPVDGAWTVFKRGVKSETAEGFLYRPETHKMRRPVVFPAV